MSGLHAKMSALSLSRTLRISKCSISRQILATPARSFSVTPASYRRSAKEQLAYDHQNVPDYPHGPARLYKKSNFGLYGGKRVRFGNIVSKGKWVKKTRRKWWPNVQEATLYSEGLQSKLRLKVTTAVLRTIDKVGGLDNYLLGSTSARIKELGMEGWRLRWELMQQPQIIEQFEQEKLRLGLTPQVFDDLASDHVKDVREIHDEFKREFPARKTNQRPKPAGHKASRKDVWNEAVVAELDGLIDASINKLKDEQSSGDKHEVHSLVSLSAATLKEMKLRKAAEFETTTGFDWLSLKEEVTSQAMTN